MNNTQITVDFLGRIKIPKDIMRTLELGEGCRVEISVENGRIILTKLEKGV